jgi:hypothetical protein
MEDLMADMQAGRIKSFGFPEADWARDYERSLLPPDTRFPREGDVYEPLAPVLMSIMTQWSAPYTGNGEVTLSPGQRIRINSKPAFDEPVLVYAEAVDYKAIERLALPWWTRWRPDYQGFCFPVKTAVLVGRFRLVAQG